MGDGGLYNGLEYSDQEGEEELLSDKEGMEELLSDREGKEGGSEERDEDDGGAVKLTRGRFEQGDPRKVRTRQLERFTRSIEDILSSVWAQFIQEDITEEIRDKPVEIRKFVQDDFSRKGAEEVGGL